MQNPVSICKGAPSARTFITWVILLALIFASMRAVGMLGSASFRWLLPLGFVLMAATPWLLLNQDGRKQIGLTTPHRLDFVWAVAAGALLALGCFLLGWALFGTSRDNWYVSIADNYRAIMNTNGFPSWKLHLIFTLPALIFSPIGEEIFFRGLLQRALEERLSARLSTTIECAAFGIVHLCHHGLLLTVTGVTLLPVSGALWVVLMFLVALHFAWLRKQSGSLYPAMASHASFNLAMNVIIFSVLWR